MRQQKHVSLPKHGNQIATITQRQSIHQIEKTRADSVEVGSAGK